MKRVMVSGSQGQLVTDIIKTLGKEGNFSVISYDRRGLDVTDRGCLEQEFERIKPDFFIQGASYHVVEEINKNPKEACDVNVASLHYLSNLCCEYNTTLINFSTNYVFSGIKPMNGDWGDWVGSEHYNENDSPHPINLYGILKYAGEQVVSSTCKNYYNIRVSGLFGKAGSRAKNGLNFPYIIKNTLEEKSKVEVVADQIINIGYTVDIAAIVVEMMKKNDNHGVYHLVNQGECTWYEVAQEIATILDFPEECVVPTETKDFYTNLKRPKDTSLNIWKIQNTFGIKIPSWPNALRRFFSEIRV